VKLVVALVFFFDGHIDHDKTIYFKNIENCRYYAQNYSKPQRNYEPVKCVCKLAWVDRKEKVLG